MPTSATVVSQGILDSAENFSPSGSNSVTLKNIVDHGNQVQVDSFAGEQTEAFLKKGKAGEGVGKTSHTRDLGSLWVFFKISLYLSLNMYGTIMPQVTLPLGIFPSY